MTRPGLTRLRIANLVVRLPDDLDVSDSDRLEANLAPFAWDGDDPPDVVVRDADAFPPPASPLTEFPVDVIRVSGMGPAELRETRPHRVFIGRDSTTVSGRLDNTMAVVMAVHLGLAHHLPRLGGVMLHASAVTVGNRAFVFPGRSGVGKSTAAHGFPGAKMLAEDRCVLRPADGGWQVHAVPVWAWRYGPAQRRDAWLAMLALVEKISGPSVEHLPTGTAVARLAPAVVHNHYDTDSAGRVLAVLGAIAAQVPAVELRYRVGESFADLLLARIANAPERAEAAS